MKIKNITLVCLMVVVVLFVISQFGLAKSEVTKPVSRMGVVSLQKILQDSKRSARYREEAEREFNKIKLELSKLEAEIGALKEGLNTLKAGSSDHMAMLKDVFEKSAKLQAQQKFYEQQMGLQEQTMVEDLFQEILLNVKVVAKQKGLDVVFERTEPQFPMANGEDLERSISGHKVLFSTGCLDITEDVMKLIN